MAIKSTIKRKKKLPSKKKLSAKKAQRGTVGNFFVFGVLALLMVVGITAVGGLASQNAPTSGQVVSIVTPTPGNALSNLQLKWFGYVTQAPTPTFAPPAVPSLCQGRGANDEPEILVGYSPAQGQSVGAGGQIKVWVTDEGAPIISQGEVLNPANGAITKPGNRTQKAPDGYLWEPALYISPQTAESGGTPHFPIAIRGDYNNDPSNPRVSGTHTGGMEPAPAGSQLIDFVAEDVWDVNSLALAPG